MEGGTTKQDYDEFEMLLGEIPNATSGNANSGESGPTNPLPEWELISIEEDKISSTPINFANFHNSPRATNNGRSMASYDASDFSKSPFYHNLQSNRKSDVSNSDHEASDQDGSNLPDNQFLSSVFEKLSFKDGVPEIPTSPDPTLSLDEAYKFSANVHGQDDAKFLELNAHKLMKQSPESLSGDLREQCQSFSTYSGAVPLNPGILSCQFLPGVSSQGLDYYFNAQSPTYVTSQHLSHSNIQDRSHRINPQNFYLQQPQNQGQELHQIQMGMNSSRRSSTRSTMHPYSEMPIPHQTRRSNWDSYLNNNVANRGYNNLDPSLMSGDLFQYNSQCFCGKSKGYRFAHGQKLNLLRHQVLDKVGRQAVPENFLRRSHGLRSLRNLNSGSITSHLSPYNADNNMRMFSNGENSRGLSLDNCDFRHASKSLQLKYSSLDEVVGRIYDLAKDHNGCRFLQIFTDNGTPEDIGKIFAEIIDYVVELMTNPFGNYLVPRLFKAGNEDQRMHILHSITRTEGELIRISCNQHGTRAVQNVIETLKVEEQSLIVSSLKPGILALMKDINGSHVVQRCLQYLSPEHCEFIFDAAVAHCIELATDRQGCCMLQKCLPYLNGEQKSLLMSKIAYNALALSKDQYGNYVVQNVVAQKVPWVTADVLNQLEGNYGDLSIQKYSSNVVEKCLQLAWDDERDRIILELMNNPQLCEISQDPYGNYVIQCAFKESKGALHAALVEAIRPHIPALRSNPYGKQVLMSIGRKKSNAR